MSSENQLLPLTHRKEVEVCLCDIGWNKNQFQWTEESSDHSISRVSKLVYGKQSDFYFKFDINYLGTRVSKYCPGEDDLQPYDTSLDANWQSRLKVVRTWGTRLLKYFDRLQESMVEGPVIAFVEAGKPRTAHLKLASFFQKLTGDLRICDPYYGSGSLLRLDELVQCSSVRFLTHAGDASEKSTLPRALTEYTKEHKNIEFRRYNGSDLHDRYVLTDEELMLLGHGLKDIGNKDSFIVRINRELASDLLDDLRDSFDAKWKNAQPLP